MFKPEGVLKGDKGVKYLVLELHREDESEEEAEFDAFETHRYLPYIVLLQKVLKELVASVHPIGHYQVVNAHKEHVSEKQESSVVCK